MNRYTKLLERLATIFNEGYVPAVLRTMDDEKDLPMDILTVALEDYSPKGNEWLAEIAFLPLSNGAEDTSYISIAITMTDEMGAYASNTVAWFISRMNHYIPYGAFSVNEEGNVLAYKLCVPVLDKGDDEMLFDALNLNASHALEFVDNFGGLIEAVMEEDITPREAMDQFLGR